MNKFSIDRYKDFSQTDFIHDSFFQDWIIEPNKENEQFWNEFLSAYPGKKNAVENARLFLKNLRFKEEFPDEEYIRSRFAEHLKAVENRGAKVVRFNAAFLKKITRVAAVVGAIVLIGAAVLLLNKKPEKATISTSYGELRDIVLPDSTHIILNAHSKIQYRQNWNNAAPREVWLEGEAFFDVKHLNKNVAAVKPGERFVVHGENVTIEVLGTSFNIRQRRGRTEVVLQSGKIKLSAKDEQIIMQPGDWVIYDGIENSITRSETIPENYSAWKDKKLLLNNPTVEEIAQYLEDIYGKTIIIKNPELKRKRIEGPILLNNLDDALFIISTVLNIEVEQKDSVLVLHSK